MARGHEAESSEAHGASADAMDVVADHTYAAVDVVVVGAGPAGSACAIAAADRGLRVVVVDKARFPRDKTCGDGLTTGALRTLESLGVEPHGLPSYASITDVVLVSPAGRRIELQLPHDGGGHIGVVTRAELDAALREAAADRGAWVREGFEVTDVDERPDGVDVRAADGRVVRAGWLVAADGHYSPVRRLVAPRSEPSRGEWSAFRQYFSGVDDDRLWVLFERDLLPGYAWVFPLADGRANVGFGMLRDRGVTGKVLAQRWRDLQRRADVREVLGPRAEPDGPLRSWPIPSAFDPRRLVHGRVLFAGDAASVVDPMTGEGIAQALDTGVFAADAIAGPACAVRRTYVENVVRHVGHDLAFAAALQRVLAHPLGAEACLRIVDASAWTRRHFARWMFEDYPRALLLTPERWYRGMLHAPGAFRGEGGVPMTSTPPSP